MYMYIYIYIFNCMCEFSCCIKDTIPVQKVHRMGSFTIVCVNFDACA